MFANSQAEVDLYDSVGDGALVSDDEMIPDITTRLYLRQNFAFDAGSDGYHLSPNAKRSYATLPI